MGKSPIMNFIRELSTVEDCEKNLNAIKGTKIVMVEEIINFGPHCEERGDSYKLGTGNFYEEEVPIPDYTKIRNAKEQLQDIFQKTKWHSIRYIAGYAKWSLEPYVKRNAPFWLEQLRQSSCDMGLDRELRTAYSLDLNELQRQIYKKEPYLRSSKKSQESESWLSKHPKLEQIIGAASIATLTTGIIWGLPKLVSYLPTREIAETTKWW